MVKRLIAFFAVIGAALAAPAAEQCSTGTLSADPNNACSGIFYQCVHGVSTPMSCPAGLKFNAAESYCDFEKNIAACVAAGCEDGLSADPKDACSSKFYHCSNGVSYGKECPDGLVFNAVYQYCDYPTNVAACKTESVTEVTTTTTAASASTEAPVGGCDEGVEFVLYGECSSSYYHCVHGKPVKRECPANLIFNGKRCEWERNVDGCKANSNQYDFVCEHETITIGCADGKSINVVKANYGRTVPGDVKCNHPQTSNQNCKAPESLNVVSSACNGNSMCKVEASNKVFGDPCVNTFKYLEIEHQCV